MHTAGLLCTALAIVAPPLCAEAQPFAGAQPFGKARSFTTLKDFGRKSGESPNGLIAQGNHLFGTTFQAGAFGYGTVYRLAPATGAVKPIYAFRGGADGAYPLAGVTPVNGLLYGVTSRGGGTACSAGCGTVFAVDPVSGTHRILYSFQGAPDGSTPMAALTWQNGLLYGTTSAGGTGSCGFGCGTVFSVDPASGQETVLHSFHGHADGESPSTALAADGGLLYGTTDFGGMDNQGVVYAVNPATRTASVIHTFTGGTDGGVPYTPLTDQDGLLYGGTNSGGRHCGRATCGVIYAIDPSTGSETVIHEFRQEANPGPLLFHGPNIYGAAKYGDGNGSIYELRISDGYLRTLYTFTAGADGAFPVGTLAFQHGAFFGTTEIGGKAGMGTAFRFVP